MKQDRRRLLAGFSGLAAAASAPAAWPGALLEQGAAQRGLTNLAVTAEAWKGRSRQVMRRCAEFPAAAVPFIRHSGT